MSLVTTPKTNYLTSDGVTNTDLNQIGENLNSLESSKYQSGSDMVANTITSNTITSNTISAVTANLSGSVITPFINTGIGNVLCYAMNQPVTTASTPTFATVTASSHFVGKSYFIDYYFGGSVTEGTIYTNLDSWVPNIGDGRSCTGQVKSGATLYSINSLIKISGAVKCGIMSMTDGTTTSITFTSGGGTAYTGFEIASNYGAIT